MFKKDPLLLSRSLHVTMGIHSFNKCLLRISYVSGTVLGSWRLSRADQDPFPRGIYILVEIAIGEISNRVQIVLVVVNISLAIHIYNQDQIQDLAPGSRREGEIFSSRAQSKRVEDCKTSKKKKQTPMENGRLFLYFQSELLSVRVQPVTYKW